jgi:hypothetical protein
MALGLRPWLHHAVPSGLRHCVVLRRNVYAVDEATRSWLFVVDEATRPWRFYSNQLQGSVDRSPIQPRGSVARSTTGGRSGLMSEIGLFQAFEF